jgi:hypothetical protein
MSSLAVKILRAAPDSQTAIRSAGMYVAYPEESAAVLVAHKGDERFALAIELVTSDPDWPRRGPAAVQFSSYALNLLRS